MKHIGQSPVKLQRGAAHAICIAVVSTTLTLGLWPFHAPRNEVSWMRNRDGLGFGRYGTVVSSGLLQPASQNTITSQDDKGPVSLEISLQPDLIWNPSTFLAFYTPGSARQLSLRQEQTGLIVQNGMQDDQHHGGARLVVKRVFRERRPYYLAVTSDGKETRIYIDGVLAASAFNFPLSAMDFIGRMVVGDSPGRSDSWSGRMLGLAIYHRQLTATEISRRQAIRKRSGRFEIAGDNRGVALYDFDERTGNVVRNKGGYGVDLHIPARYAVEDKIRLEPFWTEFSMSRDYWKAALKNIIGFIPFGFCVYPWMKQAGARRPGLVTAGAGAAVSLAIETLQIFLPTRDSGTTDLITNSLGTWTGIALYGRLAPVFARLFSWFPYTVVSGERERAAAAVR